MGMRSERSKALHNFSMPCLKWANQRFLRCVKPPNSDPNSDDIDAVRHKLLFDLKLAADNLKFSLLQPPTPPSDSRTRRAASRSPPNQPLQHCHHHHQKKKKPKTQERTKLSVSLSKEEIEHDFWALLRARPPRRPKKRPRVVQKHLDTLFPGLWLTEVSAESYKVPDDPE